MNSAKALGLGCSIPIVLTIVLLATLTIVNPWITSDHPNPTPTRCEAILDDWHHQLVMDPGHPLYEYQAELDKAHCLG